MSKRIVIRDKGGVNATLRRLQPVYGTCTPDATLARAVGIAYALAKYANSNGEVILRDMSKEKRVVVLDQ